MYSIIEILTTIIFFPYYIIKTMFVWLYYIIKAIFIWSMIKILIYVNATICFLEIFTLVEMMKRLFLLFFGTLYYNDMKYFYFTCLTILTYVILKCIFDICCWLFSKFNMVPMSSYKKFPVLINVWFVYENYGSFKEITRALCYFDLLMRYFILETYGTIIADYISIARRIELLVYFIYSKSWMRMFLFFIGSIVFYNSKYVMINNLYISYMLLITW
jgi:hypothetical protein